MYPQEWDDEQKRYGAECLRRSAWQLDCERLAYSDVLSGTYDESARSRLKRTIEVLDYVRKLVRGRLYAC